MVFVYCYNCKSIKYPTKHVLPFKLVQWKLLNVIILETDNIY
jgi:hypothetical protein